MSKIMTVDELSSGRGLPAKTARLLDRAVFVCLLGLIVLVVIPYGVVDPWWEAAFECAVFVLTALWIFEGLLGDSWRLSKLFILLPMIVITLYAFAQTVPLPSGIGRLTPQHTLTIDRYQTWLTATKTLALTIFLGLLLIHTSTPKRLRWLVRVVIGVGLGSALFGILRQVLQSPDSPAGFVLPFLFYGTGYGQFISANPFAYLMEMPFGILAGLVLARGVPRDRLLIYLAIGIPIWTALVLSNSRGGILGLSCLFIFVLFMSLNWYSAEKLSQSGRQNKWLAFLGSRLIRLVAVVLIAGTLIAGVLWMGGENLAVKLAKRDSSAGAASLDLSRRDIWRSSWILIKKNPWTGVGFGTYFLAIPEYQTDSGRIKLEEAHNDYLDLAVNGGAVAVVLALWFVALIIWRARISLRSGDVYRRAASLGAAAGILSVAVHSWVDFGLQLTGIAVVCAGLVVILVADRRVETPPSERERKEFPGNKVEASNGARTSRRRQTRATSLG